MRMKRTVVIVAMAALPWLGLAMVTAAPVAANPTQTSCPSGYQVLSVADLTAQGYHVPAQADDPANGGNGDGLVCGLPLPDAACGPDCPVPIFYNFLDNNLPAQK
jgi:hypothetical protein